MALITIAPNILDDGRRLIATASVGRGHRRRKRFPRSTPLRTITQWIDDTCTTLRKERRTTQRLTGTLAGEAASYVARLPKGRGRANTRSYLSAWLQALGDVSRKALTPDRLGEVVTGWIDAGVAASSIKHRRRALAQLLEARGDQALGTVVRRVAVPREPKTPPRGADMAVLHTILLGMDQQRTVRHAGRGGRGFRNKAQARLLLWLWTGAEPATQQRLDPSAIDLHAATITLPPRAKGEGVDAITLPFLGHGREAAARWLRAHAWGPFTARALGRAFHTAVRTYVAREAAAGRTVTLPPDLAPKHLRHSFLSWLHLHCEDRAIVQLYAQHKHAATTDRYTQRVVPQRLRDVAARINGRAA
jgi:integrase